MAHFQIRAWLQRQPLPYSALDIENITGAVQEEGRALGQVRGEEGTGDGTNKRRARAGAGEKKGGRWGRGR